MRRTFLAALTSLVFAAAAGGVASAHPLGNFTINRASGLDLSRGTVRVMYVVDMAEIPTYQETPRIDTNGDGTVTTRVPGNDGRIVVPGQGFVYGDVGLLVYTASEADPFTQLDVLMLTGHYENPDLYLDALCASLA